MPNFAMRIPSASRSSSPDAEVAQRLHQVVIGFAGAGDAEPRAVARADAMRFTRLSARELARGLEPARSSLRVRAPA